MCLTPQALIAFLTLLPVDIVETSGARVIVHAEAGPKVWVARNDLWCTDPPDRAVPARIDTSE